MVVLDLPVIGQRLFFRLVIDGLCDTNADAMGRSTEEVV